MTTERIDIEVTDKVAGSVPTKLRDIAAAAERGETALTKLKSALSALPTSKLAALSSSASTSSAQLSALMSEVSSLDARLASMTSALNQAEAGFSKLSGAATQAGAAMGTVNAGTSRAAGNMATAARGASLYATNMNHVARTSGMAGHQMGNLVAQLNDVGVSLAGGQNPLLVLIQQGSQIQYLASTVEGGFKTLLKSTVALVIGQQQVQNASTRAAAANLAAAVAAETAAAATALQAGINANLIITENALAVSKLEDTAATAALSLANAELALAQLSVMASANASAGALQRLSAAKVAQAAATQSAAVANANLAAAQVASATAARTAAAASAAAASAAAGTALGLGAVGTALAYALPLVVAVGGALYALNQKANSEAGLKDYVKTLGLTNKEMKELKDVTVTYGDTAKAVFQVVGNAIWEKIGPAVTKIWGYMTEFFGFLWKITKTVVNGLIGAFVGAYDAIVATWRMFPAALGDLFYSAINKAIGAINSLIQMSVNGINGFIAAANTILDKAGLGIQPLTAGQISEVENSYAGAGARLGEAAAGAMGAAMSRDYIGEFADAVSEQSIRNAQRRLGDQAKKLIEDRPEARAAKARKAGTDEAAKMAERREHALSMVNMELDRELSRMKMLKDERAIQQRMDQIEEALAQKKITLNNAERDSIRAKVTEIERFKYVQTEMDRITEEADGPLRTLNATREAANMLLARGAISQERLNQEMTKATRAYAEATDPLFQMKEALEGQTRALGLYGVELEKANYLEEIRLAYLAKGINLSTQSTAAIRAEIAALVAKNDALRQQQFVQSQVAAIVNPIMEQDREVQARAAVYAELQRLRDIDYLSEQQHQQAKAKLWMAANAANLSIVADGFGAIAAATAEGHGVIGAISKAAAIAQAVIQGYVAVQNALATVPYPFNFVAAAAVAIKTGTQVAGILSTNVGSYANGGQFMVAGRSGVDANNINMNVTKGERVTIETAKQQRANDNQASTAGPTNVSVPVKVVAQFDPRMALDALDTAEGERLIISTVERNPQVFQRLMGSR